MPRSCATSVAILALCACSLPAQSPDYLAEATRGVATLQTWYNQATGLWNTTNWWNAANAATAVVNWSRLSGSNQWLPAIRNTFTVNAVGGTAPVTVSFSTATGSATLAYQVDRSAGVVTVTPQDLTSAAGLAAFTAGLQAGAKVQVSGVPQADGSVRAYVVSYFTGVQPL